MICLQLSHVFFVLLFLLPFQLWISLQHIYHQEYVFLRGFVYSILRLNILRIWLCVYGGLHLRIISHSLRVDRKRAILPKRIKALATLGASRETSFCAVSLSNFRLISGHHYMKSASFIHTYLTRQGDWKQLHLALATIVPTLAKYIMFMFGIDRMSHSFFGHSYVATVTFIIHISNQFL